MAGRRTGTRIALFAIGISIAVTALSMTSLAGSPLAKALLLGSGVLLISFSLILLQLGFYREGDLRKAKSSDNPVPPRVQSVPGELKNPRLRTIWKNMEETRRLMKLKEDKARGEERRREQMLLGLGEEEEILFMGDPSLLSFWPVALLSLICVAASAMAPRIPSLLCLVAGLLGLLFLATVSCLTRYYITNFRILVRHRSLPGKRTRWSAVHYRDIHRCSYKKTFFGKRLRLHAEKETVDIKGLNRTQFVTVSGILREKMPK